MLISYTLSAPVSRVAVEYSDGLLCETKEADN